MWSRPSFILAKTSASSSITMSRTTPLTAAVGSARKAEDGSACSWSRYLSRQAVCPINTFSSVGSWDTSEFDQNRYSLRVTRWTFGGSNTKMPRTEG